MLIQRPHWLGEEYIPRSGAGQVNPTQIGWAENEGGVAPQRKFWGTGNRDWAGWNAAGFGTWHQTPTSRQNQSMCLGYGVVVM